MPRQPEGRLVRRIRSYLAGRGAFACKIHGGDNPYQEAGLPDLFVCYRGYFVGLEVKTERGEPSALQLAVLRRIEQAGGVGKVVQSVEDVEGILAKLDRKR